MIYSAFENALNGTKFNLLLVWAEIDDETTVHILTAFTPNTLCQFRQHFTISFSIQKCFVQLFCALLVIFGERKLAKKAACN